MGLTTDVFEKIKTSRNVIVTISTTMERRVQLEYAIQSKLQGLFVNRLRLATKFTYANGSTIIVTTSVGMNKPDVDMMTATAPEFKFWLSDEVVASQVVEPPKPEE